MIIPSDLEAACRTLGWILTRELQTSDYPPLVLAFREYNTTAWNEFEEELEDETSSLMFFNTERCEFESVPDWQQLAERRGITNQQPTYESYCN
jgi:hypothetical protein